MSGLPSGWTRATLGEVVAPVSDAVDPRTADVPYVGLEHVEPHTGRILGTSDPSVLKGRVKTFGRDDVLYARLRPYLNKVCAPPFQGVASSEFMVFRRAPLLEPGFLLFLLSSARFVGFANQNAEGIERPRISWPRMAEFGFGLPPLAEQRRIVAVIEEHFSRIDVADGELSSAARRLATVEAGVAAAWRDPGWPVATLGEITSAHRYGTSVKCLPDASGPLVLRIPNVRRGVIDLADLKYATVGPEELGDCFVREDDLLVIRTNGSRELIGRVAQVEGQGGSAFASYLIRLRPIRERVDSRWLVLALSAPAARVEIERRAATSAGQYNINLRALRSLPMPLPPLHEQHRLVNEANRVLSVVAAVRETLRSANRRSAALRSAILEQALRGELVPQDSSDEPASVLLERIRAERAAAAPARRRSSRRPAPTGRTA